ncbi:MAG: MFS transporter [Caldilineaceae bacterium]
MNTTLLLPRVQAAYRWYILALAALTHTLVVGMPTMSLPVLFPTIAQDLKLSVVQIGVVWGMGSLTGIVMVLLGGMIGDRIGAKRTLVIMTLLTGLLGGARGLALNYPLLLVTVFLTGLVQPVVPINVHKTCGNWFPGRQLGMANGIVSMGMALGFMLGSLLSASVLAPWLGGWRNVLLFYGAIALLVSAAWSVTQPLPTGGGDKGSTVMSAAPPMRLALHEGILQVLRLRNVWFLGFAMFGIGGAIQGALGYLPLYLQGVGWPAAMADSALATFHAVSMIFAIPIAIFSDRLGSRRSILLVTSLMITTGIGLLTVTAGPWVWPAVILAGISRDGFMAVLITSIMEVKGVGAQSGVAIGLVMACSMLASVLAPPLGNSLAASAPGLPYALWAGMALLGWFGFVLFREQ